MHASPRTTNIAHIPPRSSLRPPASPSPHLWPEGSPDTSPGPGSLDDRPWVHASRGSRPERSREQVHLRAMKTAPFEQRRRRPPPPATPLGRPFRAHHLVCLYPGNPVAGAPFIPGLKSCDPSGRGRRGLMGSVLKSLSSEKYACFEKMLFWNAIVNWAHIFGSGSAGLGAGAGLPSSSQGQDACASCPWPFV